MDRARSKLRCEQISNRVLELMLCVGLAKEMRAFHKQGSHFVGNEISCRVEHPQFRAKLDRLMGEFAPAQNRRLEIDIGEKRIDLLRGMQEGKGLLYVAGYKGVMPPILNHHLSDFADKYIILDDQYHGHQGALGPDKPSRSAGSS